MFADIRDIDKLGAAADMTDHTFAESKADSTAAGLFQPLRCHQIKTVMLIICQVDGTDIRSHRLTGFFNQKLQRFREIGGGSHFFNHFT